MKKLRVLTNVENKRVATGIFLKYTGAVLLFLFLLPYVITAFFHNLGRGAGDDSSIFTEKNNIIARESLPVGSIYVENATAAGCETIPLEIYLADKLSRTLNSEYDPEALKAQAVLLRTALVEQLWSDTGSIRGNISLSDDGYGHGPDEEVFTEAVSATPGIFLTYAGGPAKTPYFAVSNGKTRNGAEVLDEMAYPYLQAVSCDRDFLATNFTGTRSMEKNEFIAAWEKAVKQSVSGGEGADIGEILIERDSGDYVRRLTWQGISLSGEECRRVWGLDSACFHLKEEAGKIIFTVKGVGHGLGMSQFAANEMAKAEADYIEILAYFFPGTQLTKIE